MNDDCCKVYICLTLFTVPFYPKMARLDDVQREEGAAFEEGKDALNGLHFVCVQRDEDDDPAGFWLMRELPSGI